MMKKKTLVSKTIEDRIKDHPEEKEFLLDVAHVLGDLLQFDLKDLVIEIKDS